MQQCGNTNKSPNYLNAVENKFDTNDLFTNGENYQGKTPSGDFKITTPKNPQLSITSSYKYEESYQTLWPIPKYQPIVEPLSQYPIGLVLQRQSFCSMHESQYMTNSNNLKRLLAVKFFSLSTIKIKQNPWHKDAIASLERIMNSITICIHDGL